MRCIQYAASLFAVLLAAGSAVAERNRAPYTVEETATSPVVDGVGPDGDPIMPSSARTGCRRVRRIGRPAVSGECLAPGDPCLDLAVDFAATAVPPEGDTPSEMAFNADGASIVVAHRDSMNLVVFDANTRTVTATIALSGSPNSVALSSDGVHAVTANLFEDTASIVDLVSGSEIAVVPVGDQPGVVRITPDGSTAVVGNTIDSTLSVVDIATATEVRQIAGAGFAQITSFGAWAITYRFTDYGMAPDNDTVIFPDRFADQLQFFTISTGAATTVATDPGPIGIDLNAAGTLAAISHDFPESKLSVVDVASRTITGVIASGSSATLAPDVALNDTGTKAVLGVQNAVRLIDVVAGAPSVELSTGSPSFLQRTADGRYCVVANYLGSLVSFSTESIVANLLNTTTPDLLAVSPAGPRAATAHALRKETMEVMNVDGAAGFLEAVVPTGPPPEGDKARGVALTPDGTKALVINNHSQNVTVIDTATQEVLEVIPVGERPGGIAITPDGATAVVANLDSTFASIIDVAGGTVQSVGISRRGSTVAISPDGHYAYIPVVASGDGVWRIDLTTNTVAGPKIPTGNMGGIGFVFDLASGMTLSHDGATLAVCGTYDDNVSIIDTAAWTEAARVPVGDFPVRAAFSPDDSTIYVTNKNDVTVSIIDNDGPASSVVDSVFVLDQPFEITTNPAGTKLYVACFGDRAIVMFDLPANSFDGVIELPPTNGAGQPVGIHVSADGSELYVAANGADFHVIDTAANAIAETVNTGLAPAQLLFDDASRRAYIPSPFGGDGLSIVSVLDPCACPADVDADGIVGFSDLLAILSLWGPCPDCPEDIDGDGEAGFSDLLVVLSTWGPCPS